MSKIVAIKLINNCIIAAIGECSAGEVFLKEDCGDSWDWLLEPHNRVAVGLNEDQYVEELEKAEADEELKAEEAGLVDTEQDEAVTEETSVASESESGQEQASDVGTDLVDGLTTILREGKKHIKSLVEATGSTEEELIAVLTEANGFHKNQQGWWGCVKS